MQIVDPGIESYLLGLGAEKDPLQAEMEAHASVHTYRSGDREVPFPIVGPLVGPVLLQLAFLSRSKRIFELGSGFGYSAYWFARAMFPDGDLFLTDHSPENLDQAERFLSRLAQKPRIHCLPGGALESLEKTPGKFDVVFCDLDKKLYPQAFKAALPRIRRGGLLIADNTLWSGEVLDANSADEKTRAVREFNRLAFNSPELASSLLPLRDGVTVCLKTGRR